jgi:hypothetical protein
MAAVHSMADMSARATQAFGPGFLQVAILYKGRALRGMKEKSVHGPNSDDAKRYGHRNIDDCRGYSGRARHPLGTAPQVFTAMPNILCLVASLKKPVTVYVMPSTQTPAIAEIVINV